MTRLWIFEWAHAEQQVDTYYIVCNTVVEVSCIALALLERAEGLTGLGMGGASGARPRVAVACGQLVGFLNSTGGPSTATATTSTYK